MAGKEGKKVGQGGGWARFLETCYITTPLLSIDLACVCVWPAVGNGSVPVGPVVRLVYPIRAPLLPQCTMWRSFGEARCLTIAGSDCTW